MQSHTAAAAKDPSPAFAIAIASVGLIGPLAVHIFMPVIPGIRAAFEISDATAQLAFSVSLFAMAFATLIYGSLSDRFGRRPLLLTGLALFLLGSALCALASSVPMLIAGRLLQAAGAGCGVTLVRTIARDAYGPERLVKVIAYLTMFYTMGPLLAPMAGGFLFDQFGWRSVFIFAFVCGLVIAIAAYLLVPETRPAAEAASNVRIGVVSSYRELFASARFTAFVFQTGMSSAVFYTMASAASLLMKDMLDRPASDFGLWFGLFPLGFFMGNFISSRIGRRVSIETMVLTGSLLGMATTLTQSAFLAADIVTPMTLFLPGFFITFSQGISLPFAQSGAMAIIPRLVGTASGVGVFLQTFLGAIFAQTFGLLSNQTVWPLIAVTLTGSALVLIAGSLPWLEKRRKRYS